jgi:hypothetical protein
MTDLHTRRASAADRGLAIERVRTASRVAGLSAVAAAVGLTVALAPHGSTTNGSSSASSTSSSSSSSSSSATSTAPSSGAGGGAVTQSGGS